MKIEYLIEDITEGGFWNNMQGKFKGFLYADRFNSEDAALTYASIRNIGVFKITKIYDTK